MRHGRSTEANLVNNVKDTKGAPTRRKGSGQGHAAWARACGADESAQSGRGHVDRARRVGAQGLGAGWSKQCVERPRMDLGVA